MDFRRGRSSSTVRDEGEGEGDGDGESEDEDEDEDVLLSMDPCDGCGVSDGCDGGGVAVVVSVAAGDGDDNDDVDDDDDDGCGNDILDMSINILALGDTGGTSITFPSPCGGGCIGSINVVDLELKAVWGCVDKGKRSERYSE